MCVLDRGEDIQRTSAGLECGVHDLVVRLGHDSRVSGGHLGRQADDQRFARASKISRTQLEAVMVRRMKSELELRWDGTRRFADCLAQTSRP